MLAGKAMLVTSACDNTVVREGGWIYEKARMGVERII